MKTKKTVVLIQLYGKMQPPNAEPLSVEALAGALIVEIPEIQFEIYTLSYLDDDLKWERIINIITKEEPILVGISIPQATYTLSIKLIDSLMHHNPNIQIVLGHALPTYAPEIYLKKFPQIIIVKGWGEESIVLLAKKMLGESIPINQIPNLAYLMDGKVISNNIKWPEKSYRPIRISLSEFYTRIESSRGCVHNVCTFCTRPIKSKSPNTSWIRRNLQDVIDEIILLEKMGVQRFTFADEDFVGNDIDGAQEIVNKLKELGKMQFTVSVRADSIYDPNKSLDENQKRFRLFETLRDAGGDLIFVGAESFSTTQLKRYGKGVKGTDNIKSLSILQYLGINYEIGFILFDPLVTISEIKENIAVLDTAGVWSRISNLFNVIRPQKGSPYTNILISLGLSGEFNVDTLSYNTIFFNADINNLVNFCANWESDIDLIHLTCKNLERSTESNAIYAKFNFDIRHLFFRLLRTVVSMVENGVSLLDAENLLSEYYQERDGTINMLLRYLRKRQNLGDTEKILLYYCENYMVLNKRIY